jgi:shikimate dehydrogenase
MASPADTVLDLDHLTRWSFDGTALAVLGHPIAHSLSPVIHRAALAELSRARDDYRRWDYFRFDVPPERLAEALDRLRELSFRGINLTVPHKVLACGLIREIAPEAVAFGAVNTLVLTPDGWRGHNTDGYGLAAAVREELDADLAGRVVVLLGAGGAARGAAVECLQRRCRALWIANRTPAHLDTLLAQLRPLAGAVPLRGFDPASPPADLPADSLVINATSAGLRPDDPAPVDLDRLPRPAGVFDMIYRPSTTALLRQAAALGLRHANGLAMLVHQGAKSLEIWTGVPTAQTVPAMMRAARAASDPV